MKRLLLILLLMAVNSSGSSNLMAQWVQTSGPEGGETTCFAVIDTVLFVGTYGAVYFSTNNGTSWTPVNTGLTDLDVLSLAVSGDNLFAGTWGGGVFLSTDNRKNWTNVNTGLMGPDVVPVGASGTIIHALAFDDGYLYASTYGDGVWRRPLSEMITSM